MKAYTRNLKDELNDLIQDIKSPSMKFSLKSLVKDNDIKALRYYCLGCIQGLQSYIIGGDHDQLHKIVVLTQNNVDIIDE